MQASCDRVIVIHKGRLIADGTPDALYRSMTANPMLIARIEAPAEAAQVLLNSIEGVIHVSRGDSVESGCFDWQLEADVGFDIRRELFFSLAEKGWPLLDLHSKSMSLEEIFLQLIERSDESGEIE